MQTITNAPPRSGRAAAHSVPGAPVRGGTTSAPAHAANDGTAAPFIQGRENPAPARPAGNAPARSHISPAAPLPDPERRVAVGGAVYLAVLVGMSAGTAALTALGPGGEAGQTLLGLVVAGGLLVMLGCGVWLVRGARLLPIRQTPARPARGEHTRPWQRRDAV